MYLKSIFAIFGLSVSIMLSIAGYAYIKMQPPKLGGDFTLIHNDQSWSLLKQKRRLNLLYFGYTSCPDVCPVALSVSSEAFNQLEADKRENVQFIFINVDSAHVAPETVAEYASNFNSDFVGLGGNKSDIKKVLDLYGASFFEDRNSSSYLGYSISHTDRLFFLDEDGFVIDSISNPNSSELILKEIKEHI